MAEQARPTGYYAPPSWTTPLNPLVNWMANIQESLHTKLFLSFLAGALLLVGMTLVSLLVLARMSQRVEEISRLQAGVDQARQMEYLVTAQMHFRGMALIGATDDAYDDNIATAKKQWLEHLEQVEQASAPGQEEFFSRVRETNSRFAAASERCPTSTRQE